jgi:hypothetical protein
MSEVIFEVMAQKGERKVSFGALRTRVEAERLLTESQERVRAAGGSQDHWWIEEIEVLDLWRPPSTGIRERYKLEIDRIPTGKGTWDVTRVGVWDQWNAAGLVTEYTYGYPSKSPPFEPFWQDHHPYALFSDDYTRTSVMDLETGGVIATEPADPWGFCPVELWVPDWWDHNDGSILPGSLYWEESDKLPDGTWGLVAGCVWGDDWSWKIQYLDLSRITEGILTRDERFGYISLAGTLHQGVHYDPEGDRLTLPVAKIFNRKDGVDVDGG